MLTPDSFGLRAFLKFCKFPCSMQLLHGIMAVLEYGCMGGSWTHRSARSLLTARVALLHQQQYNPYWPACVQESTAVPSACCLPEQQFSQVVEACAHLGDALILKTFTAILVLSFYLIAHIYPPTLQHLRKANLAHFGAKFGIGTFFLFIFGQNIKRGYKLSNVPVYPSSSEPASDPTRVLRAGPLRPDLVFVITFRDIVPRT
jgi:hypothetical protein